MNYHKYAEEDKEIIRAIEHDIYLCHQKQNNVEIIINRLNNENKNKDGQIITLSNATNDFK